MHKRLLATTGKNTAFLRFVIRDRREEPRSATRSEADYRPCVGVMLLNHRGKVFVAQRIDMPTEAWQMPQGGIDDGEDLLTAAISRAERGNRYRQG